MRAFCRVDLPFRCGSFGGVVVRPFSLHVCVFVSNVSLSFHRFRRGHALSVCSALSTSFSTSRRVRYALSRYRFP